MAEAVHHPFGMDPSDVDPHDPIAVAEFLGSEAFVPEAEIAGKGLAPSALVDFSDDVV